MHTKENKFVKMQLIQRGDWQKISNYIKNVIDHSLFLFNQILKFDQTVKVYIYQNLNCRRQNEVSL